MGRVQGEGDYDAARRYRARAEGFVRSASGRGVARSARAADAPKELTAPERAVRKRAKHAEQDRRDAAVFRQRSGTARKKSR